MFWLVMTNKGEEEWGRKQENPRKEVNQLPRSKATLFCPVHIWSLYLEDSVLLDNVYSSQVLVPLCCTKNIRVLASCVLVGLGIQCEHPWCYHIMRLQGIQLHGTAATYLLSFPLLHSKHEGNAYEAGACSVESAVRMTQDYEVLQNACWKSMLSYCLFQYGEDLDLGRSCFCKVREIYHLCQHILGIRPK